jgi:hypothetical protein
VQAGATSSVVEGRERGSAKIVGGQTIPNSADLPTETEYSIFLFYVFHILILFEDGLEGGTVV